MGNMTTLGVLILVLTTAIVTTTAQEDAPGLGELVDDIDPYEGPIGPDSAFYGLKIAFESLDEAFTLSEGEKLEKRIDHARLRIAETKSELNRNRTEAAERVLERYREKIESVNESIARLAGNDSGLLEAQKSMAKYQYVLEVLLKAHPDSRELERSHRNSLNLEEQLASRTDLDLERELTEDRHIILREVKREREKTEVKARISGNKTQVEVKVRFRTEATDRDAIAQEILARMRLTRDNVSRLLRIEEEEEEFREKLESEAEIEDEISKVEAEFTFLLNTTNTTEIVEGTYQKLLVLPLSDVRNALKLTIEDEEEAEKEETTEIKAEIARDRAQVKVQVTFISENTERDTIAQEILARLRLDRDNISRLLRIEEEAEEFRETLEAEAETEDGISHVEAAYTFPLDTKNRTEIVDGIHAKLSALTVSNIRTSLKMDIKGSGASREDENRESEKEDEEDD